MLRIAWIISLFLLALVLGVSYSHLLQWVPEETLPAADFLTIHQVLLEQHKMGIGWLESIGAIAVCYVAYQMRQNLRRFVLALIALLCILFMIWIWAVQINPINIAVNSWSTTSIPTNWESIRSSWHQFHALRFFLAVLAFGTFAWAALDRSRSSSTSPNSSLPTS